MIASDSLPIVLTVSQGLSTSWLSVVRNVSFIVAFPFTRERYEFVSVLFETYALNTCEKIIPTMRMITQIINLFLDFFIILLPNRNTMFSVLPVIVIKKEDFQNPMKKEYVFV